MPSRVEMDALVTSYLGSGAAVTAQDAGFAGGTWGGNYGQTLLGNLQPSDQTNLGVQLPVELRDDSKIDVFTEPGPVFGWHLTAFATELATSWIKRWTRREGSIVFVVGEWVVIDVP